MRLGPVLSTIVIAAMAPGCSSSSAESPDTSVLPKIRVSPADGVQRARPDRGVTVRVDRGALVKVAVSVKGVPVPGRFDTASRVWRSSWALQPNAEYVVNATAQNSQGVQTSLTRFRTLKPAKSFSVTSVTPDQGEQVGVGMPIVVTFSAPVTERAGVERSLEVRAQKPVEGDWRWLSPTQVAYRTKTLWPSQQLVTFTAHLTGVRAAPGVYGSADRTVSFGVGRRQVSLIDAVAKQMTVRQDGLIMQRMAISAGMGNTKEYTTTSGFHLAMEKGNPVRMVSPGRKKGDEDYYDLLINHAVRISHSGEYIHAKDNVWAQGRVNVSHGCVNVRPDQAEWFYTNTLRGDPVIVSGTTRPLDWHNGWGYWQLSWEEWTEQVK
ncbi:L,D-transpeptidase [Rhizohabitans arisaemae]|uniref:L,D-transpeptidase n=1 Tax=Rhizohabitans arisaemae TaxID=2720610 RepID=UPI0024B04DA8|nr:Ig-like domain-containing protein [Rhizohabitans arisaemae]